MVFQEFKKVRGWPSSHANCDETSQKMWEEILYCSHSLPIEVLSLIIDTIMIINRHDNAREFWREFSSQQ